MESAWAMDVGVPSPEEAGRGTIGDGERSRGGRGGGADATSIENVARGGGGGGPADECTPGIYVVVGCCPILGVSSSRARGWGGILVARVASWSRDGLADMLGA